MKLTNKSENYCATVVQVSNLLELNGMNDLKGFPIFGYQCLVKKINIGDIGILFTTETQLSHDFVSANNLYRDSTMNLNKEIKGYFENNRRVKTLKIRGHISSGFFLPLSCLDYLGINLDLKVGDSFTHINGIEICRKYVNKQTLLKENRENKVRGKNKTFKRVEAKQFPEHLDTSNYWKNSHLINYNDWIVVTQKLHGTSARYANIEVKRKLNWKEKLVKWLGIKVKETEFDTIAGSRRVIKDIKAKENFNSFYDVDVWNHHLQLIQHIIPKNFIIYGEIIGYVSPNGEIQKNYSYCLPMGSSEFYVYRVTMINSDGFQVDLTTKQMIEFCNNYGLKHVPVVWEGLHKDFEVDKFINNKYVDDLGLTQCLPLDSKAPCDEGVCIRVDGLKPFILKAKSPNFLNHESEMLDANVEDIEANQSEDV